ncbi:MAG: arylsulfatase [Myxococcota bacterium]|jgi:arylsulfatase A-like enzyme
MLNQQMLAAKRIGAFTLFAAVLGCVAPVAPLTDVSPIPPIAIKPNVIVIVADDLGFSDIGALGSEIATPNIDSLAAGGTLFTNFHVAATCSPTRAMLLSGADNHRAGLGNMGEFLTEEQRGQPGYEGHLNHRVETLATRLRRVGYQTGMAGKWHLGDGPNERPHARGFDRTLALMEGSGSAWNDGSPAPIVGERTQFTRDGVAVQRPPGFSATLYVNEMIQFVEEADPDRPFFGYLAFQAVHWPHHAPQQFLDAARGLYDDGWQAVSDARFARQGVLGLFEETVRKSPLDERLPLWTDMPIEVRQDEVARMEAYAAMTMAMDYELGRLVEFLRESGRLDDTLLLFVSDNGPDPSEPERSPRAREWYERHYPMNRASNYGLPGSFPSTGYAWARVSSTPLAEHKGQPGEGGLRVPLIAHFPGRLAPGQRNSAFGYATDVVPTVLEAVGASLTDSDDSDDNGFDGQSLWSAMLGAEAGPVREEPVGYELMGNAALFDQDLKLVRRNGEHWRLFDIARDPGETENLARTRVADFERLVRKYEAYEVRTGVVPVPEDYDVMKLLLEAAERGNP